MGDNRQLRRKCGILQLIAGLSLFMSGLSNITVCLFYGVYFKGAFFIRFEGLLVVFGYPILGLILLIIAVQILLERPTLNVFYIFLIAIVASIASSIIPIHQLIIVFPNPIWTVVRFIDLSLFLSGPLIASAVLIYKYEESRADKGGQLHKVQLEQVREWKGGVLLFLGALDLIIVGDSIVPIYLEVGFNNLMDILASFGYLVFGPLLFFIAIQILLNRLTINRGIVLVITIGAVIVAILSTIYLFIRSLNSILFLYSFIPPLLFQCVTLLVGIWLIYTIKR
jgi:hypothetical protein